MLKIKAGKMYKLERMGFKRHPEDCFGAIYTYDNSNISSITVLNNRTLQIEMDYGREDKLDIFYDLIKADMVEVCDDN